MAYPDHTALTRDSVRNEPASETFPFDNYQLYPLSYAQEQQLNDVSRHCWRHAGNGHDQ